MVQRQNDIKCGSVVNNMRWSSKIAGIAALIFVLLCGVVSAQTTETPANTSSPAPAPWYQRAATTVADSASATGTWVKNTAGTVGTWVADKAVATANKVADSAVNLGGAIKDTWNTVTGPSATPQSVSRAAGAKIDSALLGTYKNAVQSYQGKIAAAAKKLFWYLAIIQISYAGMRLMFQDTTFDTLMFEIINQVLYIGFFWALVLNGAEWTSQIVSYFIDAPGVPLPTPGNMVELIRQLVGAIWDKLDFADLLLGRLFVIAPLILTVIVCMAICVAFTTVTLIESYVVMTANLMLLGFGGSNWTRQYAMKAFDYAISVGMKLLVINLTNATNMVLVKNYVAKPPVLILDLVEAVVVFFLIVLATILLPTSIKSAMSGQSHASGSAFFAAAGVAAGAAVGGAKSLAAVSKGLGGAAKGAATGNMSGVMEGLKTAAGGIKQGGQSAVSLGQKMAGLATGDHKGLHSSMKIASAIANPGRSSGDTVKGPATSGSEGASSPKGPPPSKGTTVGGGAGPAPRSKP